MPLIGKTATCVQDALGRIDAAAAIARTFLRAPAEYTAGDIGDGELEDAINGARRDLELFLSARRLARICRRNLGAGLPAEPLSPDHRTHLLPSGAIDQVKDSAADAEDAFAHFIDQLAEVIAADDDLFACSMADLLDFLSQLDAEGWMLISTAARKREPYKWIFVDDRIEADVAAFAFLELLGSGAAELVRPVDTRPWADRALRNIFEDWSGVSVRYAGR